MKSSVAHLIFFALMLTLLDCVLCYSYGRDDDTSLGERVDRLENKVEIRTNEMDKVRSVIPSENSDGDQGESTQQLGVTVLEVRRQKEGEMIRLTVKYDSGEQNVKTRWLNYIMEEEYSGINTAVGGGVYETTALFPRPPQDDDNNNGNFSLDRSSRVWLALELPDYQEDLALELSLTDHDAVQKDIPTPRLEIETAGDFVYQEGEDFSFKMRISRTDEDGSSSGMGNVHISAVLLDPTTGKVYLRNSYGDDDVLQIGEQKKFQNYEEVIARIDGTENGVSGVINFISRMDTYDGNVVNAVQRGKVVILRPSTQERPFPDGYLGVVEKPNDKRYGHTANGGDQFMCTLGEDCHYECMVAGNDITDVTVRRLKADGTSQTLTSKELKELGRLLPSLRIKQVTFHVDSIPEEPDKILCVASNAEGTSISKEVSIFVSTPQERIDAL